jgi:hypothetical protein
LGNRAWGSDAAALFIEIGEELSGVSSIAEIRLRPLPVCARCLALDVPLGLGVSVDRCAALTILVAWPGRQRRTSIRAGSRQADSSACDKASPPAAVMLRLRARYVSKAAILGLPGQIVPVKNRSLI